MQVILDSSFARPGSAPIWGGKKGEFRDWTRISPNYSRKNSSPPLEAFFFFIGGREAALFQNLNQLVAIK